MPLPSPQSSDADVADIAGRVSSDPSIIKDKPVMNMNLNKRNHNLVPLALIL